MRPSLWSAAQAHDWYKQQPWLVGCNYTPATAINQLEFWQPETFDPARIKLELGWAKRLGFNTIRVFLHDLVWSADPSAMTERIDQVLSIAQQAEIRVMLVLFDSCWCPFPRLGKQLEPLPGTHNSGWVQSPGAHSLHDRSDWGRLEAYVRGVVRTFANDPRVLIWDVWNEPCNNNSAQWGKFESPNKRKQVKELLEFTFEWVRQEQPSQPVTSGIWDGDWSHDKTLTAIQRLQLVNSDVITFHHYGDGESFAHRVEWLQRYERPLLCTEYLARPLGSTLEEILPVARAAQVGLYNWGFVDGRTQTRYPWDSWQRAYKTGELDEWFHDLLHTDGSPYLDSEVALLREYLLQKEFA
jgi:Cellulase (glycosyl hydrolase family 5)